MRQPMLFQRWLWRPLWPLLGAGRRESPSPAAGSSALRTVDARFAAQLHPLHRRFLAYRRGLDGECPHSLEETAAHFKIDPATAKLTERYLLERYRMYLDRSGWRAGHATSW